MRIAIGVEYDGSRYSGWQSQRGQRTLQDADRGFYTTGSACKTLDRAGG